MECRQDWKKIRILLNTGDVTIDIVLNSTKSLFVYLHFWWISDNDEDTQTNKTENVKKFCSTSS